MEEDRSSTVATERDVHASASSTSMNETSMLQINEKEHEYFPTNAAEIWREKYRESKVLIDHYRAQVDFLTQQLSISVDLSSTSVVEDSNSDRHGNVLRILRSSMTSAKQQEEITRLSSIVSELQGEVLDAKKLEEELRLRLFKITEAVAHRDKIIKRLEKMEISFESSFETRQQFKTEGNEMSKSTQSELEDQLKLKDDDIARKNALLEDLEEKIRNLIKEKKDLKGKKKRPVQEILLNSKAKVKLFKEAKEQLENELRMERERIKEVELTVKALKQKVRVSNAEKENDRLKNSQKLQEMMNEVATLQSMVASLKSNHRQVDNVGNTDQENVNLETLKSEVEDQIKINRSLEENLKSQLEITKHQEIKLNEQNVMSLKEQAQLQVLMEENATLTQRVDCLQLHIKKSELSEQTIREDLKSILQVAEEKQIVIVKLQEAKDQADSQVEALKLQLASFKEEKQRTSGEVTNDRTSVSPAAKATRLKESSGNIRKHRNTLTAESATKSSAVVAQEGIQVDKVSEGVIKRLEVERLIAAKEVEKLLKLLKFHKKSNVDAASTVERLNEEIKVSKLANKRKEEEISNLKVELKKESKDNESYKFKIEDLKRKMIEQKTEEANLKAGMEAEKAEVEEKLSAKIVALKKEVEKSGKLLNEQRKSCDDLVKNHKELKGEVEMNRLENKRKEEEISALEAKLKKESNDNESCMLELKDMKRKLMERKVEVENLKARIETEKAEAQERSNGRIAVLTIEIEKLQQDMKNQKKSYEDVVKAYEELKGKTKTFKSNNKRKEEEILNLEAKLKKESKDNESCKIELRDSKRAQTERETEFTYLKTRIEIEKAEAEEKCDTKIAALSTEAEKLHQLLNDQQQSYRDLVKTYEDLKGEVKVTKLASKRKDDVISTLKAKLTKESKDNESCKCELEDLTNKLIKGEAEKTNLVRKVETEEEAEKKLNMEKFALTTEVEKLHRLLNDHQKSHDHVVKSYLELNENYKVVNLDNKRKEEEITKLKTKLKKDSKDNESCKIEVEDLKMKVMEQKIEEANLKGMIETEKAVAEEKLLIKIVTLTKEVEKLNEFSNKQRKSLIELLDKYQKLKERDDIFTLDNKRQEQEISNLEAKLKKESKDNESCKFELEDLKKKLMERKLEEADLKATIEAVKAEAEKNFDIEKMKVKELQNKCKSLEDECDEHRSITTLVVEKNNEVKSLKALVDSLRDRLENKNLIIPAGVEDEELHAFGREESGNFTAANEKQHLEAFRDADTLTKQQEYLNQNAMVRKCEEELEAERTKREVEMKNLQRIQVIKDDLLKEKEVKLMDAQEKIEEMKRAISSLQDEKSSAQADLPPTIASDVTTMLLWTHAEVDTHLLEEIASYKEEIKEIEKQMKNFSARTTWTRSREFFPTRIANIKLEFENKRWRNRITRMEKRLQRSSISPENDEKGCQLCEQRMTEVADLEEEVKRLQAELSHFDEYFFDEVDDLKYNYSEAVKLNIIYEEQLKDISRRHGISINLRIEEVDGKEENEKSTSNDVTQTTGTQEASNEKEIEKGEKLTQNLHQRLNVSSDVTPSAL